MKTLIQVVCGVTVLCSTVRADIYEGVSHYDYDSYNYSYRKTLFQNNAVRNQPALQSQAPDQTQPNSVVQSRSMEEQLKAAQAELARLQNENKRLQEEVVQGRSQVETLLKAQAAMPSLTIVLKKD